MNRTCTTLLPREHFCRALANHLPVPTVKDLANLILYRSTVWGTCTHPIDSNVSAFTMTDIDGIHYSLYEVSTVPADVSNVIDREIQRFKPAPVILFDKNGRNTTFGLRGSSLTDRVVLATSVLDDIYTHEYSILWSPNGTYVSVSAMDIPFILMSTLTPEQLKEFFDVYAVIDDVSMNYIMSNIPNKTLIGLKGIHDCPRTPTMAIITKLSEEYEYRGQI